ncbi:hypothetical protein [Acetobacter ghanensis]|uniref:Uncharacterized protein n=1 Tax=Acetobacter ghanensis TaxID=431306 RepID=A0A0U5BF99_9PROT|nr:hypothetical protein [Acetobacter ghanensis]NHO39825.1 hypothetical protein [Acetobacter ghanensis]GBQ49392.1 hypothetical protein AA18895_1615 [Acetobacter ghanensis DSM 18895]CEF53240.1 hypothetical protein AGA_105 [Acetobacter ghanensis]
MTAAEISAILGIVGTVVSLAEKYGPEAYNTVLSAIEQSKSGTGPSDADIAAIFAKCQADNTAIQAS